jgi:hypothetical protein
MKVSIKIGIGILSVALFIVPRLLCAEELTGQQIREKQEEMQRLGDEEETLAMQLIDSRGKTKDREIVRYTMKTLEDANKLMIKFSLPADVKGTALLTWEHKDREDDQWLYLPALRKEKRISSSGKKNKFMGTDFTYEDLRPKKLAVYEYKLIETESIDGQECFVVEALPATEKEKKESGYGKRKLWIRKDIYYTIKEEYYDKDDILTKIKTETDLKNIADTTAWRADSVTMNNIEENHQTVLTVKTRKVNQGLNEDLFTIHMLKRAR